MADLGLRAATEHLENRRLNHPDFCVEGRIRANLERRIETSRPSGDGFVPIDAIDEVLTPGAVSQLLDAYLASNPSMNTRLSISQIFTTDPEKSRQRIIGVLILMQSLSRVHQFIDQGIWDNDLVLAPGAKDPDVTFFNDWSMREKNLFRIYRKHFFVPFFDFQSEKPQFYALGGETTLPWTLYSGRKQGNSCVVRRIRIHESHHNFKDPGVSGFKHLALKYLQIGKRT